MGVQLADRSLLKSAYPKSRTWSIKVDKMPDFQVIAVILSLKRKGKL